MDAATVRTAMSARIHHTIIPAHDKQKTARYFADLLELDEPQPSGLFLMIRLDDEVVINFAEPPIEFPPSHFAFLVSDAHFDRVLSRFQREGVAYTADPAQRRPNELGEVDGVPDGRRMYFLDPTAGHYLELITRRYVFDG